MVFRNETEQLTSEDYRAHAQKHIEALKSEWMIFFRTGFVFLATLIVLFIISVAWFTNNTDVTASGTSISAAGSNFEIRSKGSKGVHDDVLKSIKGDSEFSYNITNPIRSTSSAESSINWLLSNDNNQKNYSDQDIEFDGVLNKREDYAIEPGSKGKLTFYIVPSSDVDLSIDFTLSVTPYRESNGLYSELKDGERDGYAKQFITGHILYFLKLDNKGITSYEWIKDNTFHLDITDAKANEEYEYSIYWVWPQTLSQILLNEGDPYLNNKKIEFEDIDKSIRPLIREDMIKQPEKYFFSSLTEKPLITSDVEIKEIENIYQNSPDTTKYDVQKFVDLSSYYNQADQVIGSRISFVETSLLTNEK